MGWRVDQKAFFEPVRHVQKALMRNALVFDQVWRGSLPQVPAID
jgi:hypothetical protein